LGGVINEDRAALLSSGPPFAKAAERIGKYAPSATATGAFAFAPVAIEDVAKVQ
jgi:hypothetical protein